MAKTLQENFIDWEAGAFGFGYGSGEPHTILALRQFLELCPEEGTYDFKAMETALTAVVAWLLINALARDGVEVIGYGTSPRYGWLTSHGLELKRFVGSFSVDELVAFTTRQDVDYNHCYLDACNCGPTGRQPRNLCQNPFWPDRKWRETTT